MLSNGEYEQLESLFNEKDHIIQEIDKLDLQLDHENNGNKQNEPLVTLLEELQELNARFEESLVDAKKSIATKLIELQHNKRSDSLYHQRSIQVEGAFIDKKK
jgi:hypothetical protein